MTETETNNDKTAAWEKQPGEPSLWYNRFFAFYLLVPTSRSIRGAWILWRTETFPDKAPVRPSQSVAREWTQASDRWKWKARAESFDREQQQQALETVASVRLKLQQATPQALDALLDALTNGRTKVAAAEAIFNRAGLPPTTKSEVQASVGVSLPTAAEVARALDELEKESDSDSGSGTPPAGGVE